MKPTMRKSSVLSLPDRAREALSLLLAVVLVVGIAFVPTKALAEGASAAAQESASAAAPEAASVPTASVELAPTPAAEESMQGESTAVFDEVSDLTPSAAETAGEYYGGQNQLAADMQDAEAVEPGSPIQDAKSGEASQPSASSADAGRTTSQASKISFCYLADPESHGSGSWDASLFDKCRDGYPVEFDARDGKLCLRAIIEFASADGASTEEAAGNCDAELRWEIVSSFDQYGQATSVPIAKLEKGRDYGNPEDCIVVAQGAGNGSIVVRCISEAYPELGYRDIVVKISENSDSLAAGTDGQDSSVQLSAMLAAQGLTRALGDTRSVDVVSMDIVYKDTETGACELIGVSTTDIAKVFVLQTGACLDVMVTYSDGSTQLASQAGLPVSWELSNNIVGGKAVVSITDANALTLLGATSKLVQVKALVDGAEINGGPAYVNVVDAFVHTSQEKEIGSLLLVSKSTDGTGHTSYYSVDMPRANAVPEITHRGGSLQLSSYVLFTGVESSQYIDGSSAGADLLWQMVSFYTESHAKTDTLLAKASTNELQQGIVSALGVGNGWAIIRCVSDAFPRYCGQEMLVRILGNTARSDADVAAYTLDSAKIVYYDEASGKYVDYPQSTVATTPTVIDEPYGSVSFNVMLQFQNGMRALASDLGIAVDWRPGALTYKNVEIAQMTPSGELRALRSGNRNPSITPTVMGMATMIKSAYVRITNNDTDIRPMSDGLTVNALANYWIGAAQKPDDPNASWYWRSALVSGDASHTVPLVTYGTGSYSSILLQAAVRWNSSLVTVSEDVDKAKRTWSVTSSTDTNGAPCAPLVYVDSDGTVHATGAGSGTSIVHVKVEVPYYISDGSVAYDTLEADYTVAAYTNKKYVKSVVLLDESRNTLATSAIVLPSGKNVYQFYAQVTFVEYDDLTHSVAEKKTIVPWDTPFIDGMEWNVYRTEARAEKESYSQVSTTGSFLAQSGFSRGYVYVSMKGQSYTGSEIGAGVTVIAEDSITYLGQTDSITVKIYHLTDYANHGDSAPVAKELKLTRGQLSAMATYNAWYTFQKRNDAYATVYATGVSMRNLLTLCGVDPNLLISMAFTGTDGYFAERHSADYILGTQYRYTNYYYYKDLPGLVGSQTVAPMLALSYYMKNNAGFEDESGRGGDAGIGGYGYMTTDSTLRIIFGMQAPGVRNANQSVSKVDLITIIVEDGAFPEDPEDPEDPVDPPEPDDPDDPSDDKGEEGKQGDEGDGSSDKSGDGDEGAGGGSGDGSKDRGDDRKSGGAVAPTDADTHDDSGSKDATGDKESMEGSAEGSKLETDKSQSDTDANTANQTEIVTGDAVVEHAGKLTARELIEQARMVVPPAEVDRIWWVLVALGALVALIGGALAFRRRYVLDRIDGKAIHTT